MVLSPSIVIIILCTMHALGLYTFWPHLVLIISETHVNYWTFVCIILHWYCLESACLCGALVLISNFDVSVQNLMSCYSVVPCCDCLCLGNWPAQDKARWSWGQTQVLREPGVVQSVPREGPPGHAPHQPRLPRSPAIQYLLQPAHQSKPHSHRS